MGKDKTLVDIMNDELESKFPKLRYYLLIQKAELRKVTKSIITEIGKA
jgi:hypothetical protein